MKKITRLFIAMLMVSVSRAQNGEANISIKSDYVCEQDTLELYIWNDIAGKAYTAPHRLIQTTPDKGMYHFQLDSLKLPSWISLSFSYQKVKGTPLYGIFHMLPIVSGDDLSIELVPRFGKFQPVGSGYDDGQPIFEDNWQYILQHGGGVKRLSVYLELQRLIHLGFVETNAKNGDSYKGLLDDMKKFDSLHSVANEYLQSKMHKLTGFEYKLLSYEVTGKIGIRKMKYLKRKLTFMDNRMLADSLGIKVSEELIKGIESVDSLDSEIISRCPSLIQYWSELTSLFVNLETGSKDLKFPVEWIRENLVDQRVRDRVWAELLLKRFYVQPNKEVLREVFDLMEDEYSLNRLSPLDVFVNDSIMLDFDLPDVDGEIHKLSNKRGKIILIDFWYMGCIPCRRYIETVIKPLSEQFKNENDVEIILVSLDDHSIFSKALASGALPMQSEMLYTGGLRFKHPLIQKLGIMAFPYPLLVDQTGVIRASGNNLKTIEQINNEIKKIQN